MNVLARSRTRISPGECGRRRAGTTGICSNSLPHDVHAIPLREPPWALKGRTAAEYLKTIAESGGATLSTVVNRDCPLHMPFNRRKHEGRDSPWAFQCNRKITRTHIRRKYLHVAKISRRIERRLSRAFLRFLERNTARAKYMLVTIGRVRLVRHSVSSPGLCRVSPGMRAGVCVPGRVPAHG